MRYLIIIIAAILIAQIGAAQSIQGTILDKETGEQLPFANVILYKDSVQIAGVTTSLEGEYSFDDIAPGIYDVEAVYVGYPNHRISEVKVSEGTVEVDIKMEIDESLDLQDVVIPRVPSRGRFFQIDETLNGIIQGRVFDEKTKEGLPFANVILLQKGIQKGGTTTDLDGNYSFAKIKPGKYDVEVVYVGYPNSKITGILVKEGTIPLDIAMEEDEWACYDPIIVYNPTFPFFYWDKAATTGATWNANEIKRFPGF